MIWHQGHQPIVKNKEKWALWHAPYNNLLLSGV